MPKNNDKIPVRQVSVAPEHAGQRLDNFLATFLKGVPRAAVYRFIRTGQVRVNGGRAKAATRLEAGDEVRIPPVRTRAERHSVVPEQVRQQVIAAILHEDSDLLVIDKPAGMAVHAGSGLPWGLIDALRQARPDEYFELAHRLDRETSGCLLLARSGPALRHLSAAFREGRVGKYYLCLADGRLPAPQVDVDAPLARAAGEQRAMVRVDGAGKPALTRFRLLQQFRDCCYLEAELFSGRTHQIRVHAKHLGMPLAGDGRYADRATMKRWKERGLQRLFLHAHRLRLQLPDGEQADFHAPLPPELRQVLDAIG